MIVSLPLCILLQVMISKHANARIGVGASQDILA
jgi:hypothetical protein